MSAPSSRFTTLLFTGGSPVYLYTRLHPAVCAERLGRIPAGRGPALFAPTRDWGPRIRGRGEDFDVWFPGVGQSSYGFLRARLVPDAGGRGTWIVGRTRVLALWRILLLVLPALAALVVVVFVAGLLRGDVNVMLVVPLAFLSLFATGWVRGVQGTDRRLRDWARSALEAAPAEPPRYGAPQVHR